MSEPTDFNFEDFLHTDKFSDAGDWMLPSERADGNALASAAPAVLPSAQADVSLASGAGPSSDGYWVLKETTVPGFALTRETDVPASIDPRQAPCSLPAQMSSSSSASSPVGLFSCQERGCKKSFKNVQSRSHHFDETHWDWQGEMLCPKELCEKGTPGQGFIRKYRLVNHLMSANNNRFPGQGHGMTKGEAQRLVAELRYTRVPRSNE